MWLLQLSDVARGLIYMHSEGMIHGDLKGVRFLKLDKDIFHQWQSSPRVTSWSIKLAMPALQISDLRFSLAYPLQIYAHKEVPNGG
jgi:hypothetical protein